MLQRLADELDVPPSRYRAAQDRYDAVGRWLNDSGAEVAEYHPEIYPQGSFALGTVVKPLGDDEYDVDAVCLLRGVLPTDNTQRDAKRLVGSRLKEHGRYRDMLDPREGGRRCWTIKYADESKFHLDVLPAISDPSRASQVAGVSLHWSESAIYHTDTTTWGEATEWPASNRSNPKGYQDWFKEQMRFVFQEHRARIVETRKSAAGTLLRADVEDVPDYEVRTPLQRLIQLLKRHRDIRFKDDEDKPISIIITTLAARAYDNEEDLLEALLNVVPRMRNGVQQFDGVWWVPNPVNPDENFADRWEDVPRKRELFFAWLDALEAEFRSLLSPQGFAEIDQYIREAFGEREARAALASGTNSAVITSPGLPSRFSVPHRAAPPWGVLDRHSISISGQYRESGGSWQRFGSDSTPLPKYCELQFTAHTDAPSPFTVFWQVVNTGSAAASAGGLRGEICEASSAGRGGLLRKESTLYKGMHWIECFIVMDGKCVARSGEFVVNVR